MQRTYLALTVLAASLGTAGLLACTAGAETVPSRAPLGQQHKTGDTNIDSETLQQLISWGAHASMVVPPPPPQPNASSNEPDGIVALDVVPYKP
ncbi:MAG: hypothetical protein VKM98_08880 [Cyanobacteriota bacterium]|nr:hypothetical protein [Cyanobacteriota bacterium]